MKLLTGSIRAENSLVVLGALNGKHVAITRLEDSGSLNYNYKGFYSITLQILLNSDFKLLWADLGGLGSVSDVHIYNSSELKHESTTLPQDITECPYLSNGDDAFA